MPGDVGMAGGGAQHVGGRHRILGGSCQVGTLSSHLCTSGGGRDTGWAGTPRSHGLTEPHTLHRRGWGTAGTQPLHPPVSPQDCVTPPTPTCPCPHTPSPSFRGQCPQVPHVFSPPVSMSPFPRICALHVRIPKSVSFMSHDRVLPPHSPCPAVSLPSLPTCAPVPVSPPSPCRSFVPCPPVSVSSHVPVSCPCFLPCPRSVCPVSLRAANVAGLQVPMCPAAPWPRPTAAPPLRPRSAHAQRRCLSAPGLAQRRV